MYIIMCVLDVSERGAPGQRVYIYTYVHICVCARVSLDVSERIDGDEHESV
jgi:hypothetical protein